MFYKKTENKTSEVLAKERAEKILESEIEDAQKSEKNILEMHQFGLLQQLQRHYVHLFLKTMNLLGFHMDFGQG